MSVKSIPGIAEWTGSIYSLFFILSGLGSGFFTPCDSLWLIAIPFASGLLLSLTGDKWLKPWLSLSISLIGAGLLWLKLPFLKPVSLFLLISGYNPSGRFNTDSKLVGVFLAISLFWAKQTFQWSEEADIIILAAISIFIFIALTIWPKPAWDTKSTAKFKNKILPAEKSVRVLTNATLLLLLCVIPLIQINNVVPAILSSVVIFFGLTKFNSKIKINISVTARYLTLFMSLFLLTLMTGFLSRAHGLWLLIVFFVATVCFMSIFYISDKNLFTKGEQFFTAETRGLNEKWICLASLAFLASQFPACNYWLDRLIEVFMPESFIPLALGQYYLKNLVLIPATATLIAGYLFLRRRSLE